VQTRTALGKLDKLLAAIILYKDDFFNEYPLSIAPASAWDTWKCKHNNFAQQLKTTMEEISTSGFTRKDYRLVNNVCMEIYGRCVDEYDDLHEKAGGTLPIEYFF